MNSRHITAFPEGRGHGIGSTRHFVALEIAWSLNGQAVEGLSPEGVIPWQAQIGQSKALNLFTAIVLTDALVNSMLDLLTVIATPCLPLPSSKVTTAKLNWMV